MLVYRISGQRFANDLSGTGARLNGGRWNSVGLSLLYTASYRSLALLEILVHTTNNYVPDDLRLITIEIPDTILIKEILHEEISDELNRKKAQAQFQTIGDKWIKSQTSLILKVPSVIIPEEFNYLINPLHKDFHKVKIKETKLFRFDDRLVLK
ncbi:MAG TPA: RES family NAD+ phosphorylase [Chitinophagales bacterium]|nr:RES family NAD+ phosphorylase [Chitinophagales bacterium]